MGWLTDTVSSAWKTIKSAGKAFVEASRPYVETVIDTCERTVRAVRKAVKEANRPPPKDEKEKLERELEEVNNRIKSLREYYHSHGNLPEYKKKQWEDYRRQRQDLIDELKNLDNVDLTEEVVDEDTEFQFTDIDDETSHILQYHVGQTTGNKLCPKCNRYPMVLQWDRKKVEVSINDFFWGCTGWYFPGNNKKPPACTYTEKLTRKDLSIFANLNREEFEITSHDLAESAISPNRAKKLKAAFGDIIQKQRSERRGTLVYRCPIHGEELKLRRKRNAEHILDEFFLGCPQWTANGNGCGFIVKLKSAAQLSAVLDIEYGEGIISVTDL